MNSRTFRVLLVVAIASQILLGDWYKFPIELDLTVCAILGAVILFVVQFERRERECDDRWEFGNKIFWCVIGAFLSTILLICYKSFGIGGTHSEMIWLLFFMGFILIGGFVFFCTKP